MEPTTRGGDNARRARIVLPRAIMLRPLRGDITAGTVTQEGVTCARKRDSATRIGVKLPCHERDFEKTAQDDEADATTGSE